LTFFAGSRGDGRLHRIGGSFTRFGLAQTLLNGAIGKKRNYFQVISEHGIFRGIWNSSICNYMKNKKNK
tara:strand:- start:56 stop:262 length:207 start_codon:yes stop_codon:yes gene_type:complete